MDPVVADRAGTNELRCPTCGAAQPWSERCRRCKCDLRLVQGVYRVCAAHRRRCLCQLRAGRLEEALRQARRVYALRPDRQSARLLAVCHLLCRNWFLAATLAQATRPNSTP